MTLTNNTVSLSDVTNTSGYLTVGGTYSKTSVAGKTVVTLGDHVYTATASHTFGVYDDTKDGGWTIKLGNMTRGASVSVNGAGDYVYGTSEQDKVSIAGADNVGLDLGKGDDSVIATKANYLTADLGAGDDSISVTGDYANITAGEGDDVVSVVGSNATLNTGNGGDSITVDGATAFIDAGDGANYVSVKGESATVNGGAGSDSIIAVNANSATISAGDGADSISVQGDGVTVHAGAGDDFVSLTGNEALVYGEDGNDTISVSGSAVTVYGGAGKDSIVATGAENVIDAGDGADTISIGAAAKAATVTAGAGKDVISIHGASAVVDAGDDADSVVAAEDATITLGTGKDTVSIGATGATLTDYSYSDDTLILGNGMGSAAGAAVDFGMDGKVSVNGADVTVNTTDGYYKAKLSSSNGGTSQSYAWATDSATTINLSSEKSKFYVETYKNDESDLVFGSTGDDSIIVGSGDSVVGGKGDDSISLAGDATDVYYGMPTKSGDDSIYGATLGFDDEGITLYIDDTTKLGADVVGNNLKVSLKGSSVTFVGGTANTTSGGYDLKLDNAGTLINTEVIGGKADISEEATLIYGTGKGAEISLAAGSDDYTIDLSGTGNFGDTRSYVNINVVDASVSAGDNILIGAATATTLIGGTSSTSLAGVGSKGDSLVGGTGDDTFYYASGWGKDTIKGFGESGDDLMILGGTVTKMKRDSVTGLVLYYDNTMSQKLTIAENTSSNTGSDMVYKWQVAGDATTTYTAKIGYKSQANTFTYDEEVNFYTGGNQSDTVKVTGSDDAVIWLGHTYGGYTYTGVEAVDASNTTGSVLVWGSEGNDTLKAGKGGSTLFGGFGGNDLLQGNSSSATEFDFGKNGGHDTITGGNNNTDIVLLYDVAETDVNYTKTGVTGNDLNLVLNDGSTLTIKNVTGNVRTFQTSDGLRWEWDTSNKTFKAAE